MRERGNSYTAPWHQRRAGPVRDTADGGIRQQGLLEWQAEGVDEAWNGRGRGMDPRHFLPTVILGVRVL